MSTLIHEKIAQLMPNVHITIEFTDSQREQLDQKRYYGSFFINALALDTQLLQAAQQGVREQTEVPVRQYVKELSEQITTFGATRSLVKDSIFEHWVNSLTTMLGLPKGPMQSVQMDASSMVLLEEQDGKRPVVCMSFKTQDLAQLPFLQQAQDFKQYIKKLQTILISHPMVCNGYASESFAQYLLPTQDEAYRIYGSLYGLLDDMSSGAHDKNLRAQQTAISSPFLVSVAGESNEQPVKPLKRLQAQLGNLNGAQVYAQSMQKMDVQKHLQQWVLGRIDEKNDPKIHQLPVVQQMNNYWLPLAPAVEQLEDLKKAVDIIEPIWVVFAESNDRQQQQNQDGAIVGQQKVQKLWCLPQGVASFGLQIQTDPMAKKQQQLEFQAQLANGVRENLNMLDCKVMCQYKKGIGHVVTLDYDQTVQKMQGSISPWDTVATDLRDVKGLNLASEITVQNSPMLSMLGLDTIVQKALVNSIECKAMHKLVPITLMDFRLGSVSVEELTKKTGVLERWIAQPLVKTWASQFTHVPWSGNTLPTTTDKTVGMIHELAQLHRQTPMPKSLSLDSSMAGVPMNPSVADIGSKLVGRRKSSENTDSVAGIKNDKRL